jgi:RHS repeat-associated protein
MSACGTSGYISGQEESDFYPYGGEINYCDRLSDQRYKFGGKERDPETGADYFFARYYSSALGRFLTPDWSATPIAVPYAKLEDPQSVNLYSYVENNPATGIDPDGHKINDKEAMRHRAYRRWKKRYMSHARARAQWKALDDKQTLLVHVNWDPHAQDSSTTDYKWDANGNLVEATVTLAPDTGDSSRALDIDKGYVFGSQITDDALRQAYVIAHELAHVEKADSPEAEHTLEHLHDIVSKLKDALRAVGGTEFQKLPWVGPLEKEVQQTHYQLEKDADARAWQVVGGKK